MVKNSQVTKHATINRDKMIKALEIFGRTLTLRRTSRTQDKFGQNSAITDTDYTFTGDLQSGTDLDQRYIKEGIVEVGEGVLYIHPDGISSGGTTIVPVPEDQVVDGNEVWEIVTGIEKPKLGVSVIFYSYRCKRRINTSD